MARSAVKGYFIKPGSGLLGQIRGSWNLFVFDVRLAMDWARMKLAGLTVALFKWMGYASIETIGAASSETQVASAAA